MLPFFSGAFIYSLEKSRPFQEKAAFINKYAETNRSVTVWKSHGEDFAGIYQCDYSKTENSNNNGTPTDNTSNSSNPSSETKKIKNGKPIGNDDKVKETTSNVIVEQEFGEKSIENKIPENHSEENSTSELKMIR